MNDKTITYLGAIGALLIAIFLFYTPDSTEQLSQPTSGDTGNNGYGALYQWLAQSDLEVVSWRRRFETGFSSVSPVKNPANPDQGGDVMITVLPHSKRLWEGEEEILLNWVAEGNSLLVLAALNDTPAWSLGVDGAEFFDDLRRLTGLAFESLSAADAQPDTAENPGSVSDEKQASADVALQLGSDDILEPTRIELRPEPGHPLMQDVSTLVSVTDSFTSLWRPVDAVDNPLLLALAYIEDGRGEGQAAMWQLPHGEGTILLSASATILTNQLLNEASNAEFFANIIAWHLGTSGRVLFDDYHHGISDLYDPEAFFNDARLYATVGFVLLFWFLYVTAASNRIAPLIAMPDVSQQGDLVAAVGRVFQRKPAEPDSAALLVDQFVSELVEHGRLDSDADPWQQLASMPLVTGDVLNEVRADAMKLEARGKIDLVRLHNNLNVLRRKLG